MKYKEERPWGQFTNLYDEEYTKVKSILVKPKQRLSLQSHQKRQELWVVVRGIATVEVDSLVKELKVGEFIFIPKLAKHRLTNLTDEILEIIEVQTGSYFGEDDIIRYQDDYNRS